MDRHTYTIREKFRRTEERHTETHIKTDSRTCIHIQSDKHSGERKGHIQTHTFRRTEGQAYICSQRKELIHTETHIQYFCPSVRLNVCICMSPFCPPECFSVCICVSVLLSA